MILQIDHNDKVKDQIEDKENNPMKNPKIVILEEGRKQNDLDHQECEANSDTYTWVEVD